MKEKVKSFLHCLYMSIKKPEMEILPGNLAFFFMMMIIPVLTILATILANIDIGTKTLEQALAENFPSNIASLIESIVGVGSSSSIWAIMFGAILLASNGTYSMIVTSNSIYGIEKSSAIKNRIKSLVLVIVLVLLFILLFAIPTINYKVLGFIANLTKTDMATNLYFLLYRVLKYPIIFLFVFIFVNILYKYSPSGNHKRKTSYGAAFTSILLMISTWGYSVYIDYFSDFETIYGGISNILFLMLWINLIAYIFVLGMNLNVAREKMKLESKEKVQ